MNKYKNTSMQNITRNFVIKEKSLDASGKLFFKGIASTNSPDLDGEILLITPNALRNAWPHFVAKGAPIKVEHGLDPHFRQKSVGTVTQMQYTPDNIDLDTPNWPRIEILVTGVVTDLDAIKSILSGEKTKLSLSWGVESSLVNPKNPAQEMHTAISIRELSICAQGVNTDAKLDIITESELKTGNKLDIFGQIATIKSFDNEYLELDFDNVKMKAVKVKYRNNETKSYRQIMMGKRKNKGKSTKQMSTYRSKRLGKNK